jgi:ABC-type cobalamin/Fe3+-siderophores transport system ATPase subunit
LALTECRSAPLPTLILPDMARKQHFLQLHRPLRRGPRIDLHAHVHGSILAARYADTSLAINTGHIIS